jgi:hypothetical protein
MKVKVKLGMGSRKRSKRSKKSKRGRILVAPKSGGFLPFLLPLLGALGALGGGAAGIATAVNKANPINNCWKKLKDITKQWKPFHRLRKVKECVRKEKSVDKEKDYMLDHINGIKKTTDKITTSCID